MTSAAARTGRAAAGASVCRGLRAGWAVAAAAPGRARAAAPGGRLGSSLSAESSGGEGAGEGGGGQAPFGFGYSAGGMLYPYFLGTMKALRAHGAMDARTPIAGR